MTTLVDCLLGLGRAISGPARVVEARPPRLRRPRGVRVASRSLRRRRETADIRRVKRSAAPSLGAPLVRLALAFAGAFALGLALREVTGSRAVGAVAWIAVVLIAGVLPVRDRLSVVSLCALIACSAAIGLLAHFLL
jgi:hypothetical protein